MIDEQKETEPYFLVILISLLLHGTLLFLLIYLSSDYTPDFEYHKTDNFTFFDDIPTPSISTAANAGALQQPAQQEWGNLEGGNGVAYNPSTTSPSADNMLPSQTEPEEVLQAEEVDLPITQSVPPIAQSMTNDSLAITQDQCVTISDTLQEKKRLPFARSTHRIMPQQKKQINLSQFLQSFLQYAAQDQARTSGAVGTSGTGGGSGMHMMGKKGAEVTLEQRAVQRYWQKVVGILQNSFKIYRHLIARSHIAEMKNPIEIDMGLARDGSVIHLQLISSSGSKELDDIIFTIFHDVRTQLPPFPAEMKGPTHGLRFSNALGILQNPISSTTLYQH